MDERPKVETTIVRVINVEEVLELQFGGQEVRDGEEKN